MLSLASRRRRLTRAVTLAAALAAGDPATASVPPVVEFASKALNFAHSQAAAGVDVNSTATHFTRNAG